MIINGIDDSGPLSLNTIPRERRRKVLRIVKSMPKEDREAWDEMIALDEDMLLRCLIFEYTHGGVFDLDGIKKHFKLSRAFLGLGLD